MDVVNAFCCIIFKTPYIRSAKLFLALVLTDDVMVLTGSICTSQRAFGANPGALENAGVVALGTWGPLKLALGRSSCWQHH